MTGRDQRVRRQLEVLTTNFGTKRGQSWLLLQVLTWQSESRDSSSRSLLVGLVDWRDFVKVACWMIEAREVVLIVSRSNSRWLVESW